MLDVWTFNGIFFKQVFYSALRRVRRMLKKRAEGKGGFEKELKGKQIGF